MNARKICNLFCACFLKNRRKIGGKSTQEKKLARACFAPVFVLRVFCACFARDCIKQNQDVLFSHGKKRSKKRRWLSEGLNFSTFRHFSTLHMIRKVLYFHNLQYQADPVTRSDGPKPQFFGNLGLKFDLNGPNLGPKILLSASWPPLVRKYHCQLSQYTKSGKANHLNSIKCPKTFISLFRGKN